MGKNLIAGGYELFGGDDANADLNVVNGLDLSVVNETGVDDL